VLIAAAIAIAVANQLSAGSVIQANAFYCYDGFPPNQICSRDDGNNTVCDYDTVIWDNVSVSVGEDAVPGDYGVWAQFPFNWDPWINTIHVAADGTYTVGSNYWSAWAPNGGSADHPTVWSVTKPPYGAELVATSVDADGPVTIASPSCGGHATTVHGSVKIRIGTASAGLHIKPLDKKDGGNECGEGYGMARYSAHSREASLNIIDTPIRYRPPRGPAIDFTATYNQRENQQPQVFTYSNLGQKWSFNWLSYATDDPNNASANVAVYVSGGGTEMYSGFNSGSQSYLPDAQSGTVLVRASASSYEKDFPDGSKQIFNLSDGSASFPRKIFMTQWIDPAGNAVTIGYDSSFRINTITDALGQVTTLSYELAGDPLKITKVKEPFPTGRTATFTYNGNGQLTMITDEIGIQSKFTYAADGTNFITSLQTPYGTSNFATGQTGPNRWIEMTDPLGSKERLEYSDNSLGYTSDSARAGTVPTGFTNSGLGFANTFYWDKRAMQMYPPVGGVYDHTKARITHWALNSDGTGSGTPAQSFDCRAPAVRISSTKRKNCSREGNSSRFAMAQSNANNNNPNPHMSGADG